MTPIKATPSEARRYERNVKGQGKPKKKRQAPRRVTIHVAPDVKPETVAALAALALRVMEMPEEELREFLKKVRRK